MPNIYEIKFKNGHGSDGNYCFFIEEPIINSKPNDPNAVVNAWITWITRFVPAGSDFTIKTTNQYFVSMRDKLPSELVPSTIVSEGHSEPVNLGATDDEGDTLKMILKKGSPAFEKPHAKAAFFGSHSIPQGFDFEKDDNTIIGLGQHEGKGNFAPVGMILADQNMITNIQHIVKLYVKKTDIKRGTVINWQSFSTEGGVIDFSSGSGQGRYKANVSHDSTGAFIVEYE